MVIVSLSPSVAYPNLRLGFRYEWIVKTTIDSYGRNDRNDSLCRCVCPDCLGLRLQPTTTRIRRHKPDRGAVIISLPILFCSSFSLLKPVRVLRYHQIIKATRPIISSFHHLELAQTPGFSRLFLECPPVAAAPQSREHLKIESFHGCNHLWITISAMFRDHSSCRYPHLCIPLPLPPFLLCSLTTIRT